MLRNKIVSSLKQRKEELSMPYDAIAKRANVGVATVKRVFDGKDVSIGKVESIIVALELDDDLKPKIPASKMIKKEIDKKIENILSRITHTSALEMQSPSVKAKEIMRKDIRKKISTLPRSRVWQ